MKSQLSVAHFQKKKTAGFFYLFKNATNQKKKKSKKPQTTNHQTYCFAVKRYIRKGIPNEHRALIWMIVSGAQANMEQNPGYYHRLLEGEKNDKLVEAIKTGYCFDTLFICVYLSYVLKCQRLTYVMENLVSVVVV